MTVEEYLLSYRDYKFKIDSINDTINDINSYLGVSGISFESDGSYTVSKNVHKREEQLASLATLKDELEKAKLDAVKKQREIVDLLYKLDNIDERYVLYYRYITFYKYDFIAEKLNFSVENIYILRRRGLEKLNEIYSKLQ